MLKNTQVRMIKGEKDYWKKKYYDDSSLIIIYQKKNIYIYIYIYLCKRDLNLLDIILSIELTKTYKKV